ncbi:hypothetical protein [Hydrogenophaga sp.]|uniref:hypothetical protein n=1 Tax=Hydrogenophaga sp. TaxID=1904254 RepID=UPI003AF5F684
MIPNLTPPGTVHGVQILLGAGFVVGFLQAVPGGPFSSGAAPTLSSFLTFLASSSAAWVMGWAAHHGSASLRRSFSAALATLCIAAALMDLNLLPAHWMQLGVYVLASALLYAPSIQEWFAIRQAQRTDPLSAQALWQVAYERRLSREQAPADVGTFITLCAVLAGCAAGGAALIANVLT